MEMRRTDFREILSELVALRETLDESTLGDLEELASEADVDLYSIAEALDLTEEEMMRLAWASTYHS